MTDPRPRLPDHFTDEDRRVARRYPQWPAKGEIVDGKRLTILTASLTYEPGEEVRVIHAFEATREDQEAYVMGPKPVHGEYVDGSLASDAPPEGDEPWIPPIYDGPVLDGPEIDFNYEVTTYRFSEPAQHNIVWTLGPLESNTLEIECDPAT